MYVQIEITTRCNFDCFYCAGRAMPQGDMGFEDFCAALDNHVARFGVPERVSLQGEGEPTLHHDFFRMAAYVRRLGSRPYTITNGSYKYPEHFLASFESVGVSIDTLDEAEAVRIGRYNLPRVLDFVDRLRAGLAVTIHTVSLSPGVDELAGWCRARGLRHVVQPLQSKSDYRARYPLLPVAVPRPARFACSYVTHDRMRFYALDGRELPCNFIKDAGKFPGMETMRAHLGVAAWPACCTGCRFGAPPRESRRLGIASRQPPHLRG